MLELPKGTVEAWEVLDLLTSLVQKSLVVYDEDEQGHGRYRLLETVRQYARDRLLEAGEGERVRDRHLACFLALAEAAEPELYGRDQVAWLERLEAEHDNLRAALAWSGEAVDSGQWLVDSADKARAGSDPDSAGLSTNHQPLTTAFEKGLRLGGALWRFWSVRGYLAEGSEHLRSALSHPAAEPTVARARALDGGGLLAMNCGDFATAAALFEEALSIGQALDDPQVVAIARNSLGDARRFQGDAGAARGHYEEALRLGRELNDLSTTAYSLTALGILVNQEGNFRAARCLFEEGLGIKRALGDKRSIAYSLAHLAGTALAEGNSSAARSLFEESLTIYQELGDRRGIAFSLDGLSMVARKEGQFGAARALLGESLAIFREVGDRRGVAMALHRAAAAVAQSQPDRAARLFAAAARQRELTNAALPPADRAEQERCVAAVRTALAEEAFAAAWAEGSALSLDEAVAYAVATGEAPNHDAA